MKTPKMIGAHTPKKVPWNRGRRCRLNESAEMIKRAYEEREARRAVRIEPKYRPLPLK